MDRLTSMAIFVRAVDLSGFAPAAKEADISATMVAKHVNSLEARLGARLLNRTTRRQSLTEVGKLYYDRCKTLLAEVDAAESSVSALRASPRGTLRLTAPVSFGTRRLAAAPDIPTIDEAGLPGFYVPYWFGLWAPKDTPEIIIGALNKAVVEALADETVHARLNELGREAVARDQQTPDALAALQRTEIAKWWPIIAAAGVKAE